MTRHGNWGVVTNAGLAIGAVAVADTHPSIAAAVVGHATHRIRPAMGRFAADGSPEGLAYWRYATEHAVKLLATLEAGSGGDFGLGTIGGFSQTGSFALHGIGPTRKVGELRQRQPAPGRGAAAVPGQGQLQPGYFDTKRRKRSTGCPPTGRTR